MMTHWIRGLIWAVALFALGACYDEPVKVTGGGSMGGGSFGFAADNCSPSGELHGRFTFVDKASDVQLVGTVIDAVVCSDCTVCGDGEMQVDMTYKSISPRHPGAGVAVACFTDGGEGADSSDQASLLVLKGPFHGFQAGGEVDGNIQAHPCD